MVRAQADINIQNCLSRPKMKWLGNVQEDVLSWGQILGNNDLETRRDLVEAVVEPVVPAE